jgi:type II secretory pathway component PulM
MLRWRNPPEEAAMTGHGPSQPLEERLGSRAAFEAHQKSEAERTARYWAHRRAVRRAVLLKLGGALLILAVTVVVIYFAAAPGLP